MSGTRLEYPVSARASDSRPFVPLGRPVSRSFSEAVEAWPLKLSEETRYGLEDNLLLFFTGYARSASKIR